jgi:allophanate hydrolase subunit 2
MESEGVIPGAVQVTPNGQPIILLNDHGTTGGYPVIGTVVAADLDLAAQLLPGDEVVFHLVSVPEAVEALRERERCLETLIWISK